MGSAKWKVGVRFHPTEEELMEHYKRKMEDEVFRDSDIMPEIDLCKYDPWDLPEPSYHAMELFFFSPRDYKYPNSNRFNRRTPSGYWKPTGEPRMIKDRRSNAVIAKKRTLTFYRDGQPIAKQTKPIAKKTKLTGSKTNWVMHQYDRIENANTDQVVQRDFVLYRVKQNPDKDTSICDEGQLFSHNVPYDEYQPAAPEYYTSSTPQSPELEVFLQANGINDYCTQMQSPFGDKNHFVTDKNDISTCDEGGSHNIPEFDFQNEAAYNMFQYYSSSAPQSPEPGVLLQANDVNDDCIKMQSPFGDNNYFVTDKNDISTCDEGDPPSITAPDFQKEAAYDMIPKDYCSSTSQSPLYTYHGSVPHDSVHNQEDCMQISTFWDNRSIIYDEQDNNIAEVYPQPENLALVFSPTQVQDYTLLSPWKANEGDILHDNNYIACDESYSPIWSNMTLFPTNS